ncbi:unnamed protein product [Rhizopus microsporus]
MFLWLIHLKKFYKDIAIGTAKQIEKSELTKAKGERKPEDVVPELWIRRGTCTFKCKKTNGD